MFVILKLNLKVFLKLCTPVIFDKFCLQFLYVRRLPSEFHTFVGNIHSSKCNTPQLVCYGSEHSLAYQKLICYRVLLCDVFYEGDSKNVFLCVVRENTLETTALVGQRKRHYKLFIFNSAQKKNDGPYENNYFRKNIIIGVVPENERESMINKQISKYCFLYGLRYTVVTLSRKLAIAAEIGFKY